MNSKQREYILNNYNQYGIEDIKTKEDMIVLLNILEAHDETLDGLHDVQPYDMFCDIFFNYSGVDDNYVYNTLFEYNIFYASKKALVDGLRESFEEYDEIKTLDDDELIDYISENWDDVITKTTDGYVRTLYY